MLAQVVPMSKKQSVMEYVGIDVSKSTFVVAYSSGKPCRTVTFRNTAEGVRKFISTLDAGVHHCVLEATGNYGMLLVYLLSEAGITVSLENPKKIKNFARAMLSTVKTDEIDARLISLYGERMHPAPYRLPSGAVLMLKQKRTVLRQLKRQLVAMSNTRGSMEVLPYFDPECKKVLDKTVSFLEKQIRMMEAEIASVAESKCGEQVRLLTSVKGIGVTLATALIVATGGFTYFDTAKQLTRYLGLSPTYERSGTSVRINGHINRNGDSHLRGQLYVAALSSLRCNTECKAFYDRLRSKGKPGKLAVVAVANKLVRQAFAVVTHGRPYVDGFKSELPARLSCEGSAMRQWTAPSTRKSTT